MRMLMDEFGVCLQHLVSIITLKNQSQKRNLWKNNLKGSNSAHIANYKCVKEHNCK